MTPISRFATPSRQQGNTLTGIIIGLVVGLVIAVVVALAITKGATPFTDKSGKMGKAAEPTAGQAADPNKPLYGNKDAAREANREFHKEAKALDPDPLGQAIASLRPDPAPAAHLDARALTAEAPPVKPAPAVDDAIVYYLQVGAFRETSDAENVRAKLALLGYEAAITERSGDMLHRVRLGPYNQVEAMNKVRTKLNDNGITVAVVRQK